MIRSKLIVLLCSLLVFSCSPSRQSAKLNASVDITEHDVIRRHLVTFSASKLELSFTTGELKTSHTDSGPSSGAANASEPAAVERHAPEGKEPPPAKNSLLLLSNGFGPPRKPAKPHLVRAAQELLKRLCFRLNNPPNQAPVSQGKRRCRVDKHGNIVSHDLKALVLWDSCFLKKSMWKYLWREDWEEQEGDEIFRYGAAPGAEKSKEVKTANEFGATPETLKVVTAIKEKYPEEFERLDGWFCEDLSDSLVEELNFRKGMIESASIIDQVAGPETKELIFDAYLEKETRHRSFPEREKNVAAMGDLLGTLKNVDLLAVNGGNPDMYMFAFNVLFGEFSAEVKQRLSQGTLVYIGRSAGSMISGLDMLTPETDIKEGSVNVVHQTLYRVLIGDRPMIGFDQVHPEWVFGSAEDKPEPCTMHLAFRPHFGGTVKELAYILLYNDFMDDRVSLQTCENNNGVLVLDTELHKYTEGGVELLGPDPLDLDNTDDPWYEKIKALAHQICEEEDSLLFTHCVAGVAPSTADCVIRWRQCIWAIKRYEWPCTLLSDCPGDPAEWVYKQPPTPVT